MNVRTGECGYVQVIMTQKRKRNGCRRERGKGSKSLRGWERENLVHK